MKKLHLTFFSFLFLFAFAVDKLNAQQWDGYTLYSTMNSTSAYLIDTNSTTYHSWTGLSPATGYSSYLLPGGSLIRTVKHTGNLFSGGGVTGEIQTVDWNGVVTWDFVYSTSTYCAHHDICPMPNGNVLLISYESKTSTEVAQAGCSISTNMWPDKVVEIQPTGATTGTVVWEWHLWDHLCQSYSPAQNNYVTSIGDHPELFDINSDPQIEIWHMNGIDYNPILDQIIVSSHNQNEMYIIDHSTTSVEASGHTGGIAGKGGDFLYRWGQPGNYGQSATAILNVVHDAHWIPEGSPNAGRIVGFNNNGISNSQSSVDQVDVPLVGYNYSYTPNMAYSPTNYSDRLACTGHATNMSNSEQFPNGNQLICVATSGVMYEVDPSGSTIWSKTVSGLVPQAHRYSLCYLTATALPIPTITINGAVLTCSSSSTYQWYLNGISIPGATNQSYTTSQSGIYIVRITDASGCVNNYSANLDYTFTTAISNSFFEQHRLNIYPNPTNGVISIDVSFEEGKSYSIKVSDATGRIVLTAENSKSLDLSSLQNGIYFISVTSEDQNMVTKKITLVK